eukprot:5403-Amorphochlora_amoeboformis.AAC.1
MEAKTEKKKVEEEKVDASLSIFEERDSDPKVLRKVKILDRSKEFGKTEGKEKSKELSAETEKALRAAFKKWSLDKKTIGRTEVIRALRSAGTMPSEEDLDSIMEGISQGNGKIDVRAKLSNSHVLI